MFVLSISLCRYLEAPAKSLYRFGSMISDVKFKNRKFFFLTYDTTDSKLARGGRSRCTATYVPSSRRHPPDAPWSYNLIYVNQRRPKPVCAQN